MAQLKKREREREKRLNKYTTRLLQMRGNEAIVFCPVVEQVLSLIWKMSQGAADKDCNFRNPFPLESGWCSCGTNYVRGAVGSHIESGHWLQMVGKILPSLGERERMVAAAVVFGILSNGLFVVWVCLV
ncbi:hypothetical protein CEXT_328411 [Caerostris extrusa]|uniref:Uncharacterized protein n=1 Tax=Caerostris extrusa TaxID=172846 RepID=A0AAV4U207_CAEEX|nr:hypothetical protein CEXT_328411 [Caerostris extrusa]